MARLPQAWMAGGAFLLALLFNPVFAAGEEPAGEQSPEKDAGVAAEIQDLAREIEESMREKGEFVRDSLGEWSRESSSWLSDRGIQARAKTALAGVLGVGSVASINVDVEAGVVTLQGELESWDRVARAVRTVQQIESVRRVVSRLEAPGAST